MSPALFKKRMLEEGFSVYEHPVGYPTFSREVEGKRQFVIRDNVRGGAWRIFLGVNRVPLLYPQEKTENSIEAESPWFEYVETAERQKSLNLCWEWLSTVGFEWLRDPQALSKDEWRQKHNILIKGVS